MKSKLFFIALLLSSLLRVQSSFSQEVLIGYSSLFNYNTIPPLNVGYSSLFTFNSSSPAVSGLSPLFNFDTRKIVLNPESVFFGDVVVSNCATQNYLLSGKGLTSAVSITTPAGFQVSLQSTSGFSNSLLVQHANGIINQNIFLKFCPSNAQLYEGSVLHSSSNAISKQLSVNGSGVLNAPLIFNVYGGGSFCQGDVPSGISVWLDGSQNGITYQLLRDGNPHGVPLSGNGTSLTWFDLMGGLYTVLASNPTQSTLMNGSATIVELELLDVTVSINTQATEVCEGFMVDFFATPINGGSSPLFEWKVNGTDTGTNSPEFSYTPSNNDVVTVNLTSSETCSTGNPATSNANTMAVNPLLQVSVTIQANETTVCEGENVSFSAIPVHGGTNPTYQWYVNGNFTGNSNASFDYIPSNQDLVSLLMTSNETCTTGNPASSNIISMTVNPIPIVTWIDFEPDTLCVTWEPILLSGGFPLGGTYSGTGVIDNLFHPSLAGIGTHILTYTYISPFNCQSDASKILFVDNCTKIEELTNEPSVLLYPNPAGKIMTVGLSRPINEETSILVINIFGQIVLNKQVISGNEFVLDISSLASGKYHIQIRGNTLFLTKPFIVNQ